MKLIGCYVASLLWVLACSTAHAAEPETPRRTDEAPWIEIIGAEGPSGIAKIGKRLTQCGDVKLKQGARELVAQPGGGVVAALSPQAGRGGNLHSKQKFGDCHLQLEFLMASGSNSGVKLQQRYEIQLYDSHDKEKPTARECGGIYPHWVFRSGGGLKYIDQGVPPTGNAAKPAGEWQELEIVFRAPRFDAAGKKTENARFESVLLNGKKIHEAVEVDSPTGNASTPMPEVAEAPIMFQLDHGAVAFRNVRVRRLNL